MNREDIFEKLAELNMDKDDFIVISGASLVVQGIVDCTSDIDMACDNTIYSKLNWPTKMGLLNVEIKYYDCFEIGNNLYYPEDVVVINGYQFLNLERCLEIKRLCNKKSDKKIIEKLDLLLCSQDSYRYERKLKNDNIKFIAGVDEVGRGPLVGPVVAACVVLPEQFELSGLTDSKKLSEKKREEFFIKIKEQALGIGVSIVNEKVIDEINIYEATKVAMREAIKKCQEQCRIDYVLIDAMPLDVGIPTMSIIKGDLKSITISAASVIAKVTRDRMLDELDKIYPVYDFKNNKGYPTKKHLEAISNYGIIDEHRKSYAPVKKYLEKIG